MTSEDEAPEPVITEDEESDGKETRRTFLSRLKALPSTVKYGLSLAVIDPVARRVIRQFNKSDNKLPESDSVIQSYRQFCSRIGIDPLNVYIASSKDVIAETDTGSIYIASKLREILNPEELLAVLIHETGHTTARNEVITVAGSITTYLCATQAGVSTVNALGKVIQRKVSDEKLGRRVFLRLAGLGAAGGVAYEVHAWVRPLTDQVGQIDADSLVTKYGNPEHLASALRKVAEHYTKDKNSLTAKFSKSLLNMRLSLLENGSNPQR